MASIRDVEVDDRSKPGWSYLTVALYLVGIVGLAGSLTVLWLSMRAVLDIGGFCAEGGPYVINQHCPDGVAWMTPLSVYAGLGSAALVGWMGGRLGPRYASLVVLAWPALFISLGWNFLEYAFAPPEGAGGDIAFGWLIPGIMFVIMGAVPLITFLPRGKSRQRPAFSSSWADFSAEGEARYLATANASPSPSPSPASAFRDPDPDVVSRLERLAALYGAGSLTYDEFQRAKATALSEAGG